MQDLIFDAVARGSTQILTHAATPAVVLADVKRQLRLTDDDLDTHIEALTLAAIRTVETASGTCGLTQTLVQRFGRLVPAASAFALWRWPVQSINSITYLDAAGAEQTLDPSNYRLIQHVRPAEVAKTVGADWPSTLAHQPDAVRVTYTAGHTSVNALNTAEPRFRMAVLLLVTHWFEHPEPVGPAMSELPLSFSHLIRQFALPTVW